MVAEPRRDGNGRLRDQGSVENVHIRVFTHLFSKYFLSAYYVPRTMTVLGWEHIQDTGRASRQTAQLPLTKDQHRPSSLTAQDQKRW